MTKTEMTKTKSKPVPRFSERVANALFDILETVTEDKVHADKVHALAEIIREQEARYEFAYNGMLRQPFARHVIQAIREADAISMDEYS